MRREEHREEERVEDMRRGQTGQLVEKGIAAGACGVQREKERWAERRQKEILRGDQAPAVRMGGSYSSR